MDKTINQYINQLHLDPKREAAVRKIVTLAGGSGGGGMTEITYAELKELRNNGKLVPGAKYRMIDYETTTSQEGTQAAGHPFDLILTALDEKTLDEKCSVIQSARDTEGYFANSNLAAWEVWYSLDNDFHRFSWADAVGLRINVDLTDWDYGIVLAFYDGEFIYNGEKYHKWNAIGVAEPGCSEYILTKDKNVQIGENTIWITIFNNEIVYEENAGVIVSLINSKGGKGVIYRMIDEAQNDTSYDLKNIMYRKKILDGNFDNENGVDMFVYTFNHYKEGENVDGTMNNKFFIYDNVIKYNTKLPFNVFLSTNELQINNIVSLDSYDCTFGNYCFDIYISHYGEHILGDDCFGISMINCHGNRFIGNCSNIKLINECSRNTFGFYCSNITLGEQCFDNFFDEQCRNVEFSYGCNTNKLEGQCGYVKLLPNSTDNTLHFCSNVIIRGNNIIFSKENNDRYDNIEIIGKRLIISAAIAYNSHAEANNYKIYCQHSYNEYINMILYTSDYCKYIYANSPHKDPIEYTDQDIYNAIQATKTN